MVPAIARKWSVEMRRAVLLHELAHVKRGDVPFQFIARLACALYWFHPLAWLALRHLRQEREQACDDVVICAGESPTHYAERLVEVARLCTPHGPLALAVGMARRSSLESRLQWLFDSARSHRPLTLNLGAALLGVTISLVCIVVAIRPVPRKREVADGARPDLLAGSKMSPEPASSLPAEKPQQPPRPSDRADYTVDDVIRKGSFTITGRVIDEATGAPVAGAKIIAEGYRDAKHLYETTSDADGLYRFELENDSYSLLAAANGRWSSPNSHMRIKVGELFEARDLKIADTARITGKVVEKRTGLPVTTTRNGEPLTVAWTFWGEHRSYGSAPVRSDGTYALEVPPFCRSVYLQDPAVKYECEHLEARGPVKSGETRSFDIAIVGERNDAAFVTPRTPLDDVETAEEGAPLSVDQVVERVRAFHASVKTGEFIATEEFALLEKDGRSETRRARIRGVFDREREQVRHEFEWLDPPAHPHDKTGLVILFKDFHAVANGMQVDLLTRYWIQNFEERFPLDPMAVGLFSEVREPHYVDVDKERRLHDLQGFEEFLFKMAHSEELKTEIRAFTCGEFAVLLVHVHNPKLPLDFVRRMILDPAKGYAPVRTVDVHAQFGNPVRQKERLTVSWEQQGNVWIPVQIDAHLEFFGRRERRNVRLDWKSVNRLVSPDEFDIFQMMPDGFMLGFKNLSPARQAELSERLQAYQTKSHEFRNASFSSLEVKTTKTTSEGEVIRGEGLAVVVHKEGYLVTPHRLVDAVDSIQVTRGDRTTFPARVVASDPMHDLALLKVAPDQKLNMHPFGNSSSLKIGAKVFRRQHSRRNLQAGRITALGRDFEVPPSRSLKNLIQFDGGVPGAIAGGPLVNTEGQIVGICVATSPGEEALDFAIPIDDVKKVIAEMIANVDKVAAVNEE